MPVFSKQQYRIIAAAVKANQQYMTLENGWRGESKDHAEGYQHGVDQLAIDLAVAFKKDNPRFDEKQFFYACGWKDREEIPHVQ